MESPVIELDGLTKFYGPHRGIEDIEALRGRSLREVRITFDHDVDPGEFARLPGVHDVSGYESTLVIRTGGDIDAIVKQAARHHVVDLVSEQADLEAVFLAFYGGTEEADEESAG